MKHFSHLLLCFFTIMQSCNSNERTIKDIVKEGDFEQKITYIPEDFCSEILIGTPINKIYKLFGEPDYIKNKDNEKIIRYSNLKNGFIQFISDDNESISAVFISSNQEKPYIEFGPNIFSSLVNKGGDLGWIYKLGVTTFENVEKSGYMFFHGGVCLGPQSSGANAYLFEPITNKYQNCSYIFGIREITDNRLRDYYIPNLKGSFQYSYISIEGVVKLVNPENKFPISYLAYGDAKILKRHFPRGDIE